MTLSYVQSTVVTNASQSTLPFALGSTPTAGNILVAFCNYSQYSTTRTITAPSGSWTQVFATTGTGTSDDDSMACFTYTVQGGDGKNWTFTVNGSSADYCSGEMYEITGASTSSPVNGSSAVSYTATTGVITPSVTPTVLGCLPLAAVAQDGDGVPTSVTSGWTLDQVTSGTQFHNGGSAHKNSLTSDTSTAITCTFNMNTSAYGVSATVLIAPAGGQSVSLTAPNVALAAPVPAVSAGATVALTAPNLALAAPLVSVKAGAAVALTAPGLALTAPLVSAGSGAAVSLTAPNLALTAPVLSVSAATVVALTTPGIALAAPVPSPKAGAAVALTAPGLALAAPPLSIGSPQQGTVTISNALTGTVTIVNDL